MNHNKNKRKNQVIDNINNYVVLDDPKADGKQRVWVPKKNAANNLADIYGGLGYEEKAFRCKHCGEILFFRIYENGIKILDGAHFCQIRLCPLCSWRREIKIFSDLSKVVQIVYDKKRRFIFLTLTCKNVYGDCLIDTMDMLYAGFKRMTDTKRFRASTEGYFRALEITHDVEKKVTRKMYQKSKVYYDSKGIGIGDVNPNFDKYHPHFHVMIDVNPSYFKDKNMYIEQSEWTSMWQRSIRADYVPQVHVEVVKNRRNKGVLEVAKYTVKDSDYIIEKDRNLAEETVVVLDKALAYRRLIAYGGTMKEIHKKLGLKEDIDASVHIDENEELITDLDMNFILQQYNWHVGFKNYVLTRIMNRDGVDLDVIK